MNLSEFHFTYPIFLWALLIIPIIGGLYFFYYHPSNTTKKLETFIDPHLLPYVLVNPQKKNVGRWKMWFGWLLAWVSMTVALAGPRWNYREIETFSPDQSLVVLLDLSESMNSTDVKPSRLGRAKQKIEDLISASKGIKIGLIAFAADPHMITPITDDLETIRHLLPSMDTSLVHIQGSRLSPALDMAFSLLKTESGNNKAVLIISDGGFEDTAAISQAKKMANQGVTVHTIGLGTESGAPLYDSKGNIIKKNGTAVFSKLEKERLNEVSIAGKGRYFDLLTIDDSEKFILDDLTGNSTLQLSLNKKIRLWEEEFYLFLVPVLPIFLWWFRRGSILVILPFILISNLSAHTYLDYFKNSEELGEQAFIRGDYQTAVSNFQDPYRKGVALYKAGCFTEAEEMFKEAKREAVSANAAYNLGNCLAKQEKFKEAISAYEEVLSKWPDHIKAKDNLELIKKITEQQQEQEESNQANSNQDSHQNKNSSEDNQKNQSENSNQESSQNSPYKQSESDTSTDPSSENTSSQTAQQDTQDNESTEQTESNQQSSDDTSNHPQPSSESNKEAASETQPSAEDAQEKQRADFWLNRLQNDPGPFLKNKFSIESKKNKTKESVDPW